MYWLPCRVRRMGWTRRRQRPNCSAVDAMPGGETYEIDAKELVPGDIVLLESGERIPADMRLLASHDLEVDESGQYTSYTKYW